MCAGVNVCVRRSECGCAYLHTEINVIYMYIYVRVCKEQLNQHLFLPLSIPPSLTPQVLAPSLLKLYLCSSFSCIMIMGYCATLNSGQPAIWLGRGALTCNANSGRSTPEEMCSCRKR